MQYRKATWQVRVAVFLALVGSVAVATGALIIQEKQGAPHNEKSLFALEDLRGKFASINSVHLVANATVVIYGENFATGHGSFEYWAEGDRNYRIKCITDKNLKLNTDLDIAYDGQHFQFLDLRSGMLSFGKQEDFRSHVSLPNPFFLPLEFLSIEDEDCALCRTRLSDLKREDERWKTRSQGFELKSRQFNNNTLNAVVEMPGGKLYKRPFKLRLTMNGPDEENAWPVKIERIGPEGQTYLSIEFKSFMENSWLHVPREILITARDEKGSLALRLEYEVRLLEINQPLANNVFKIDFRDAENVWDSDLRKLVKEKVRKTIQR